MSGMEEAISDESARSIHRGLLEMSLSLFLIGALVALSGVQ